MDKNRNIFYSHLNNNPSTQIPQLFSTYKPSNYQFTNNDSAFFISPSDAIAHSEPNSKEIERTKKIEFQNKIQSIQFQFNSSKENQKEVQQNFLNKKINNGSHFQDLDNEGSNEQKSVVLNKEIGKKCNNINRDIFITLSDPKQEHNSEKATLRLLSRFVLYYVNELFFKKFSKKVQFTSKNIKLELYGTVEKKTKLIYENLKKIVFKFIIFPHYFDKKNIEETAKILKEIRIVDIWEDFINWNGNCLDKHFVRFSNQERRMARKFIMRYHRESNSNNNDLFENNCKEKLSNEFSGDSDSVSVSLLNDSNKNNQNKAKFSKDNRFYCHSNLNQNSKYIDNNNNNLVRDDFNNNKQFDSSNFSDCINNYYKIHENVIMKQISGFDSVVDKIDNLINVLRIINKANH